MDFEDASILWRAMPIVEARERLWDIRVSAFPHSNEERRTDIENSLTDEAYPDRPRAAATWDDVREMLGQAKGAVGGRR